MIACDALYRYLFLEEIPDELSVSEKESMLETLKDSKIKLRKSLNPELIFSDNRCSKLLPEAHKEQIKI
jgi:hypothetical protein